MNKSILKISEECWQKILNKHSDKDERISFLMAKSVNRSKLGRTLILAAEQPIIPADDCYKSVGPTHLKLHDDVATSIVNQMLLSEYDTLINIHSHPFSHSGTSFSSIDDADDINLDGILRRELKKLGREFCNLSIVVDRHSFDGRFTNALLKKSFRPLDEVQIMGEHLRVAYPNSILKEQESVTVPETQQRHDFIGSDVISWLSDAKIGVLGAGGLSSIYTESLVRLGCRELIIIDDDVVEESNLNRLQGVKKSQVGTPKVFAIKQNLKNMIPDAKVKALYCNVMDKRAQYALSGCDIILGGVDNALPRAVLNHISVQYLIPYFDAAVDVTREPVNFRRRVHSVLPFATACMHCSPFDLIDDNDVAHSLLSPEMEAKFRNMGYISDAVEAPAPSVYPLNMSASGDLMTELLNYLGGFKSTAVNLYSNYQESYHQRADKDSYGLTHSAEDCPTCSFYKGIGDAESLPFKKSTHSRVINRSRKEKPEKKIKTLA